MPRQDADRTIEIWTDAGVADAKAALPTLGRRRLETNEVKVSDLADNLSELLEDIQVVFERAQLAARDYVVEEIELNVGVNAKGGLALIGKVEAGVEAGIKVKLKRRTP